MGAGLFRQLVVSSTRCFIEQELRFDSWNVPTVKNDYDAQIGD
jgi:hypothetical protein